MYGQCGNVHYQSFLSLLRQIKLFHDPLESINVLLELYLSGFSLPHIEGTGCLHIPSYFIEENNNLSIGDGWIQ